MKELYDIREAREERDRLAAQLMEAAVILYGIVESVPFSAYHDGTKKRAIRFLRRFNFDRRKVSTFIPADPTPWDWIPHTEGSERQEEINQFLRKAMEDARMGVLHK